MKPELSVNISATDGDFSIEHYMEGESPLVKLRVFDSADGSAGVFLNASEVAILSRALCDAAAWAGSK